MVCSLARGCLSEWLAGGAPGSFVGLRSPASILCADYLGSVWLLVEGSTFDAISGQPTDDFEMALAMARQIAAAGLRFTYR